MKLSTISLAVFLVASLFAAGFSTSPVHAQPVRYGPKMDHISFRVVKGPATQTAAMTATPPTIDILTGLRRPADVLTLAGAGKKIVSGRFSGDHFSYVAFNMRPTMSGGKPSPFGPQSGGEPGRSLRHAIAHLVPKTVLIGTLFNTPTIHIATLIDGPMAECIGTFEADVDTHPFDPVMATDILTNAGYTFDGTDWYAPGSVDPLPSIDFLSLPFATEPNSWTIASTIVTNMGAIGLKVTHTTFGLTTLINRIDAGNFDMFLLYCEDMGKFGGHLYDFFHSNNDFPKGYNRPGLRNTTHLDPVLWELYTTLDQTYMEQKVAEALELLMGTSAYENTFTTDGIIPYIPIYSRTHYDAYDPGLFGIVNAKMKGSWNYWTACNIFWGAAPRGSDLFPGKDMMIFCWWEDPQYPANPLWVSSTVTWDLLDYIYDGLIDMNPYNLRDRPGWLDLSRDPDPDTTPGYNIGLWTVTDGPAVGEQGMKVTFYLNTTVPRYWHDGHLWDAYDVAFGWEYCTANKIPRAWGTFKYFHHCTVNAAADAITAYMTTTGITLPLGLSTWSTMTPEHIWGNTFSRGGRAVAGNTWVNREDAWNSQLSYINSGAVQGTAGIKPHTDADWNVESGLCVDAVDPAGQSAGGKLTCEFGSGCVLDDRTTPANEILDYDPAAYIPPTAASSPWPVWITEQIGTGPFVYFQINLPAGRGDLIAFDESMHQVVKPGVHYCKSNNEIHNEMVEMFWEIGDVDLNGEVEVIWDLVIQGDNFFMPVPPAPSRADINKDNLIDIRDMWFGGRNYGEEREV